MSNSYPIYIDLSHTNAKNKTRKVLPVVFDDNDIKPNLWRGKFWNGWFAINTYWTNWVYSCGFVHNQLYGKSQGKVGSILISLASIFGSGSWHFLKIPICIWSENPGFFFRYPIRNIIFLHRISENIWWPEAYFIKLFFKKSTF